MKDLLQYISEHKNKTPDAIFLSSPYEDISYKKAYKNIDAFAAGLRRMGLINNEPIAILGEDINAYILSYYGILKNKNKAVLLPVHLTKSTLNTLIKQTDVNNIVYTEKYRDIILDIEQKRNHQFANKIVVGRDRRADYRFNEIVNNYKSINYSSRIDINADAAILFTSGTTGFPKGVVFSHKNIITNVENLIESIDYQDRISVISSFPIYNYISNILALNTVLIEGGSYILSREKSSSKLLESITKHKANILIANSYTYHDIFDNVKNTDDLKSLSYCLSIDGSLKKKFITEWQKRFNCEILEGYGLTEAPAVSFNKSNGEAKPKSVGYPLANTRVKIINENGADVPDGEIGELALLQNDLLPKYLDSRQEADTKWFRTGDLFQRDINDYLYFKGRKYDIITKYGYKISPGKIKHIIMQHDKIRDVFVLKITGGKNNQIKLCVVPERDKKIGKEEIFNYSRENLPRFLYPDFVEFYQELPRNKLGKIKRSDLL
ncbi:MAG: acyl--CoA ligase [Candidatus Marinimicrobia bacterium]|nr:acyl--CoA ligase [Candidatus Neomarinimicrobiota bacterium]